LAAVISTVWPFLSARVQRHHGAVDARAAAAVAQVGVHGVGKVHRRGARGQLDHRGLGRQHVDAVVQQAVLGGAGEVALPGQQLAQHGDLGVVLAGGADAGVALGAGLLVGPVRGHAVLGVLVHGAGADLDFQARPSASRTTVCSDW
jgi:hypothetical protein